VAQAAEQKISRPYAWGQWTMFGAVVAVLTCIVDQVTKVWLLNVFDLADRGQVALTPFLDLALTWNTGISYGLFQQDGAIGRWALLAFKAAAVVFLWIWLARARSRLAAAALGLIIGGALGNAIDRLHWPGVMDFVLFHIEAASFSFRWYVFNLADVAIVAGVVGLLYDSLGTGAPQKRPDAG
jgi:signal peptidase II